MGAWPMWPMDLRKFKFLPGAAAPASYDVSPPLKSAVTCNRQGKVAGYQTKISNTVLILFPFFSSNIVIIRKCNLILFEN